VPKTIKTSGELLDRIARTTYIDAVYCYRLISMVCQSVTLVSPAKTAELIEMPFALRTPVGPGNQGQFWEKGSHIVKYKDLLP